MADDIRDATSRTELASERTVLAWWRSGLAAFAVALAVGRVVPELSDARRWPYAVVGVGFGLLGIAYVWRGHRRAREVEAALRRGESVSPQPRVMAALTVATVLLGVATVLLVAVDG
jgi:uncharacterized membrane protein YidH (DUF202 family)